LSGVTGCRVYTAPTWIDIMSLASKGFCGPNGYQSVPEAQILPVDDKYDAKFNFFLPAEGNHLFNEPEYFKLQLISGSGVYAQLVRRSDSRVFATLAFHETSQGVYISPGRGTYGGVSFNGSLDLLAVERFLEVVMDYLRGRGAQCIRIRCAPASHDPSLFAIVSNALSRLDFLPEQPELNFDMRVDSRRFIDRIDYGNVKRIRKAEREGFICERADFALLPAVHELLDQNRARMGISISMSLAQLSQMVNLFPERFHLFAAYRDACRQSLVAAAVSLEVASSILYVLYWGDAEDMRSYSPIAFLASSVYEFCVQQGIGLLDVGISTVQGVPNHGLVKFKRNLGFAESLKLEMVWSGNLDGEKTL
jgi:hypothetical protein